MLKAISQQLKDSLKLFYWRFLSTKSDRVAITYANDKLTDGAGSQLQKSYAIYAAARLLKVPYIHSPLSNLGWVGVAAFEKNVSSQDFVARYNNIFRIPSDIDLPQDRVVYDIDELRFGTIEQLKRQAAKNNTFILARVLDPFGITDNFPEAYQALKEISPFPAQSSSVVRVAIHVRRGDIFAVAPDRALSNAYYLAIVHQICRILEQMNLDYVFELYTEAQSQIHTVTAADGALEEYYFNHYKLTEIVLDDTRSNPIRDFDAIPNLKKFINTDPIETMERMATANVLIICHSSFSYLPALLNHHGIVIYHKFRHSPLQNWLIADDLGQFSMQKFIEQIKAQTSIFPLSTQVLTEGVP